MDIRLAYGEPLERWPVCIKRWQWGYRPSLKCPHFAFAFALMIDATIKWQWATSRARLNPQPTEQSPRIMWNWSSKLLLSELTYLCSRRPPHPHSSSLTTLHSTPARGSTWLLAVEVKLAKIAMDSNFFRGQCRPMPHWRWLQPSRPLR